jgi:hypothetical protein
MVNLLIFLIVRRYPAFEGGEDVVPGRVLN